MKLIKTFILPLLVVSVCFSCNNAGSKPNTTTQNGVATIDSIKAISEGKRTKDTAKEEILSITAMFVDFTLGDAEHYTFTDKAGKTWEFGGCDDKKNQFAVELPEAQANEANQGFGGNKALQKKWFDLKYVIRTQPEYQDGPMAKVPIIVEATIKN